METIRSEIGKSLIWISADETTDLCGRYIANLFIGKLSLQHSTAYLIAFKALEKVNHSTIVRFINDRITTFLVDISIIESLHFYFRCSTMHNESWSSHQNIYPNLIHVICFANVVHCFAEDIQNEFLGVNKLISAVKKVFMKATPLRIQTYREQLQPLPLPP